MLVSIDPGKHIIWVAWWTGSTLVGVDQLPALSGHDVAKWLAGLGRDTLAIEIPMVYPGLRVEDPNDLIDLTERVGWCTAAPWKRIIRYRPRQWKGQVPKKTHNTRIRQALSIDEKFLVQQSLINPSLKHNIWDAIGIGLKFLKRM